MGRPVGSDGQQTRQAILDAALELFADKGYLGTSIRDIAGAVGVRESALYNHFSSKEAIVIGLLDAARAWNQQQLAAALVEPITDVRAVLEQLAATILDHFCEPRQRMLFLLVMSDGMRLARQGHIDLMERMTSNAATFYAFMQRLIDEGGLRPRDSHLLAMEFMGPLLLWRHFHAIDPGCAQVANRHAFARDHVHHFLSGVQMVPSRRARSDVRTAGAATTRPAAATQRRRRGAGAIV